MFGRNFSRMTVSSPSSRGCKALSEASETTRRAAPSEKVMFSGEVVEGS